MTALSYGTLQLIWLDLGNKLAPVYILYNALLSLTAWRAAQVPILALSSQHTLANMTACMQIVQGGGTP